MQNVRLPQPSHKLLLTLVLTLAGANVFGQQILQPTDLVAEEPAEEVRRYSVELIIFQNNDPGMSGTEIFLPDELPVAAEESLAEFEQGADGRYFGDLARQAETATGGNVDADGTATRPPFSAEELILNEVPSFQQIGLRVMQPEEFVLNDIYDKLEQLSAYTPLLRTAWVQETVPEEETRPIKLRRLGSAPLRLDGNVALYLGRYLHLVLDLALEERAPKPVTTGFDSNERNVDARFGDNRTVSENDYDMDGMGNPQRSGPVYYRIQEDRIVRNGELRYYDHPRFGAIAKITRIEENQQGPEDSLPGTQAAPVEIRQNNTP